MQLNFTAAIIAEATDQSMNDSVLDGAKTVQQHDRDSRHDADTNVVVDTGPDRFRDGRRHDCWCRQQQREAQRNRRFGGF